jgi:hypothetical protein
VAVYLEHFAVPDDKPPLTTSDIARYEKLRVITDAHTFVVPLILLAAAIFLFFSLRLVFARDGGRVRRLIALWFEAKERELKSRIGPNDEKP